MQVLKDLAGAEDILLDAELPNTVEQSRGGSDYTITKVSAKTIPYAGTFGQPGAVYIKDKLDDIDTSIENLDYIVDTIEDLETYTGTSLVMIKDINRGGTFVSKTDVDIDPNTGSLYAVNDGTIFAKSGGGFWVRQFSGAVNVKWFGAKGDGVTDDTAAIQAAINYAYTNNFRLVTFTSTSYYISGTIILLPHMVIDLNQATLIGSGIGSSIELLNSGTLINGVATSNIDSTNETRVVISLTLKNGNIKNTGTALHLKNCIWGCNFQNLIFTNCTKAIHSHRSWYTIFEDIISLGSANNTTEPAFYFSNLTNVEPLRSIRVTDRKLGFHFKGGIYGQGVYDCSAESCDTGMYIAGEVKGMIIQSGYFEGNNIAGIHIESADDTKTIKITGCFFNDHQNGSGDAVAIIGKNKDTGANSYIDIDDSNVFYQNDINIDCRSNKLRNSNKVGFATEPLAPNTLPSLTDKLKLGKGVTTNIIQNVYSNNDTTVLQKSYLHGGSLIPFHHEGSAGAPEANNSCFVTTTKNTTNTANVILDIYTKLVSTLGGIFVYNLRLSDNQNTYYLQGFMFGITSSAITLHELRSVSGKTVTASVVDGYVHMSVSGFNTNVNSYVVIRHV